MKRISISIIKAYVLHDIDSITYKRVDGVMSAESDSVRNALSSDSEEPLDECLLQRYMEGRDAQLRAKLSFCIARDKDEDLNVTNAPLRDEESFDFVLDAPDHFGKDTVKALAQKIHKYFVDGCAYDWYTRQGVEYSVGYEELDQMLSEIAVSLRKPFVKRPLQPFGPR